MSDKPQHLEALDLANRRRHERSALRAWVKEPADALISRHRLAEIVETDPVPACVANMLVEDLLRWSWKASPLRVRACCELADCTPLRPLGKMSGRQRRIVAGALRMPTVQLEEARRLHAWEIQQARRAAA